MKRDVDSKPAELEAVPKVSVAIATWKPEGLENIIRHNYPELPGVEYVVSWQAHENAPIPEALVSRGDFRIFRFDGKGVSANRNNAFKYSRGEIIFVADDDLDYNAEELAKAISAMEKMELGSMGVFAYSGPDNKQFPTEETDLGLKGALHPPGALQIAVRRSKNGEIPHFFDERFGPGAKKFTTSEDVVYYLSARKKGMKIRFFPIVICRHGELSTGYRPSVSPGAVMSEGAVIGLGWPRTAPLRLVLKAYRLSKSADISFFKAMRLLFKGYRQ